MRRKYKIGREVKEGGQRNIGNPYSGKFLGADGHEYYCTVDNDGNPIRNMVPKYEVFQTEDDGPIGKLSLSAKDFTSEEDVIKMFAKKNNRDPREIRLGKIEKNTTPALEVIIDMPSDPLIIEALKIAYEFAMTSIPYYSEDSNSKLIGELLISDKIAIDEINWFEQDSEVLTELSQKLYFTKQLQPYEHIAFLTSISGKGLYAVVKIFDFSLIFLKLSPRHYNKLPKEIVLFNDSISSLP